MSTTQNNKPADTIRYGGVKGTIWRNSGKDGKPDHYSVVYSKSYLDADGNWQETHSLSEIDNLKQGIIQPKVASRITELKAADRAEANGDDYEEEGGQ